MVQGAESFKAAPGAALDDPDRDPSLGAYVNLGASVIVVEDTTQIERFADNPLVDHERASHFIAGAPLVVNGGHPVGALCLRDY